jgi:hypothetical protein
MSKTKSSSELIPSNDRKVHFWKNQSNTFGLLPGPKACGGTCPGATKADGGCYHIPAGRKLPVCYASRVMHCYGGVRRILENNTRLLTKANQREMERLLNKEFARFRTAELAHMKRTGITTQPVYRLHWSGDVFSERYAKALANAIRNNRDIMFWNYTRSFDWVKHFHSLPNLVLYLSMDQCNLGKGLVKYQELKPMIHDLRIAYMGKEHHLKNLNNMHLKLTPCPVDSGKLELEGGCAKCGICWRTTCNVFFSTGV